MTGLKIELEMNSIKGNPSTVVMMNVLFPTNSYQLQYTS